jgi:hypothetical protein
MTLELNMPTGIFGPMPTAASDKAAQPEVASKQRVAKFAVPYLSAYS